MYTFKELKKLLKNELAGLPTIKVALVGDTATQFLATAIKGMGVERGFNINLFEAEYNQVERQFMDPTSDLYQFDADFIVVFQSTHKLGEHHSLLPIEQQLTLADDRIDFITSICENPALAQKKIIYFNYPEIGDTVFGSYANKVTSSLSYQVRKLNFELMNLSQQYSNLFICDMAEIQNKYGRDFMFDTNIYVGTEMVISIDALPHVASRVMDIMCGLGNMLGIQLPENFERPFFAKSINEFWQRWHISLGTWLRDYIFYPVSLSKGFTNLSAKTRNRFNAYYANLIPTSVALFFVWFTNGFWHGAGWKYIVYGLYYYTLMMLGLFFEPLLKRICSALKINRESTPFNIFRIIRTVIIVNIGMLIFRADNLKTALYMFRSLFTDIDFYVLLPGYKNGFNLSIYDYAVIGIGFIILLVVGIIQEKGVDIKEKIYSLPMCLKWVILIAALFVIIIFGAYGEEYGVVDLIYANF